MATGFLKFDHDHTVYIDLDLATDEVKKAVIIDADDVETPICGGGGGDFTTAKLTVTNTDILGSLTVYCTNIDGGMSNPFIHAHANEPETFDIILYKDKAVIDVDTATIQVVSYSGDIHLEGDPEYLVATGDCSITIKSNLA